MKPREFAEALSRGEKFLDSISGEIISIYGGPDITGDVVGYTDDGRMIKANAKNLELANEKENKSDSEKLEEMMAMLGLGGSVAPKDIAVVSKSDEITSSQIGEAQGAVEEPVKETGDNSKGEE